MLADCEGTHLQSISQPSAERHLPHLSEITHGVGGAHENEAEDDPPHSRSTSSCLLAHEHRKLARRGGMPTNAAEAASQVLGTSRGSGLRHRSAGSSIVVYDDATCGIARPTEDRTDVKV